MAERKEIERAGGVPARSGWPEAEKELKYIIEEFPDAKKAAEERLAAILKASPICSSTA